MKSHLGRRGTHGKAPAPWAPTVSTTQRSAGAWPETMEETLVLPQLLLPLPLTHAAGHYHFLPN